MEENKIIEEGIETVTDGFENQVTDVTFDNLPTLVEESGNGDIQVLPLAIGIGIGGALVLGVKKIYKIIKARKEAKYLKPEEKSDAEETKENDDEEDE